MPSPIVCFNDLVGMPYKWGAMPESGFTDCLGLCSEIRRRLGMHDYREDYAWVYEQWDESNFPSREVLRWLRKNGQKTEPVIGAIGYVPDQKQGFALVTMVSETSMMMISPGEKVARVPIKWLSTIQLYRDKSNHARA